MVTLEQFKTGTLGKSYGNPTTNTFVGECVSYVRQYMEQVLGVKTAPWGNAVDYWTNPEVLKHFDRIKIGNQQEGDIPVWGDDPGTWTGKEGHIGILYKNQLLNQNYNGSRIVTINDMFSQGLLGYLRKKDMLTNNQIIHLYRIYYGRAPLDKEKATFVGKVTFDQMADKLRLSDAYKKRIAMAKAGTLIAKNHLPNDLRANYIPPVSEFVAVNETLYRKK